MKNIEQTNTLSRYVGQSVRRQEDFKFITGHAQYVDDISPRHMLSVAILRSPYAHALVKSIDVEKARALPGVVATYTGADLKEQVKGIVPNWIVPGMKVARRPVLAYDKVRFAGEGIVVVVAEELAIGYDALDLIEVDYEPLDVVTNAEQALEPGAPILHDEIPGNLAVDFRRIVGDFAQAKADADVHITQRLINQRLIPSPLEPRAVLAEYDPFTDKLTLYTSTQIPHVIKQLLAETLNFPEHKLRVIAPDVGGGFGAKLNFYPEELLCAFLTQKLHRPVKWTESRNENQVATTHGRDQIQDVELTAMRDGTITGLKVVSYANLGAYQATMGAGVPTFNFGNLVTGNYKVPVLDETIYCVMTNTTPTDAYRGAGRPEATYLIERIVDLLARALGMDPVEVHRKNFIQPHEFPYRVITGVLYDSGNYEITLEKALTLTSYYEERERQRELRKQGRYLGIGMAMYTEICGQAPSRVMGARGFNRGGWESTTIRVHQTGKVTVYSGSSSHGQGHATSFAQIVADDFGVPIEDVGVVESDTAQVQFGYGTFNSRSIPVGGSSVKLTAQKVVAKAIKIAAHLLEAPEEDIEFRQGQFSVKGVPRITKSFPEVAKAAYLAHDYPSDLEPGLEAQTFFNPQDYTAPFGTHIAIVELDAETGDIEIKRYVAVDDAGNIISPLLAEGQIHGGIAQGIGQALYEGAEYDNTGQLLTGTLMDYALPLAKNVPAIETAHTVTPALFNPLGAKGIGEAGAIVAPAAIVNAVIDALSPWGIVHLDMPLKREKVWQAIQNATAS